MTTPLSPPQALDLWRRTLVAGLLCNMPDLSVRQLSLLLTVYMTPAPHTVRKLAQDLKLAKPAITRAVDKLQDLGFVKRKEDPNDKRSVIIQRTVKGSVFLRDFAQSIQTAAASLHLEADHFQDGL